MLSWLGVPAHALITLLMPIGGAAAAIVIATVLIRLVLLPVGYAQYRADQRRAALFERMAELQRRHRGDRERLNTELTRLYAVRILAALGHSDAAEVRAKLRSVLNP